MSRYGEVWHRVRDDGVAPSDLNVMLVMPFGKLDGAWWTLVLTNEPYGWYASTGEGGMDWFTIDDNTVWERIE